MGKYRHSQHMSASNSADWAGYEVQGLPGTFKVVQSTFEAPSLDQSVSGIASIWAGIGGQTKAPLVQAGIDFLMDSGQESYNAWAEVYTPDKNDWQTSVNFDQGFHPGDIVTISISSGFGNNPLVIFDMQNDTTHEHHLLSQRGQQFLSDGTSSECIVERLNQSTEKKKDTKKYELIRKNQDDGQGQGDGQSQDDGQSEDDQKPMPLANFGTEKFLGCSMSNGKNLALLPIGRYQTLSKDVLCRKKSNVILAAPGNLDAKGQAFAVKWLLAA